MIDDDISDRAALIAYSVVVVREVRVEAHRTAVKSDLTKFSHFGEIAQRLVHRPQRDSGHLLRCC